MIALSLRQPLRIFTFACLMAASSVWATTNARAQDAVTTFPLHDSPRELPELRFQDGERAERILADFRGKVVLLNVWATWCVPCRKEMPMLDRLQAQLGGSDFEVVALSIDRAGISVVEKFYKEIGLKALGMYVDSSGKASRALGIVGLPTTVLIGRDGAELGRSVGPAEWNSPAMVGFFRKQIERRASGRDRPRLEHQSASTVSRLAAMTRSSRDQGINRTFGALTFQ